MYQSWLASNNWWIFCFTRCVVQHLGIPEKYLGLQSILEGYICLLICPTFLEVDPKSLDNFISISTQSSGFLHPIFLAFSDLVAGFLRQPGRSCMTAFLQDPRPLVPCATGDTKLLEGLLCDCNKCPRKYSTCLIVLSFCDKEGLDRLSSLLSDRIFL